MDDERDRWTIEVDDRKRNGVPEMRAIGRVERTTTCPRVPLPLYSSIIHLVENVLDIKRQKQQRVSRAVERILRLVCSKHLAEVMNEIPSSSSPTSSSIPPESEKQASKRNASSTNSDEQSDCDPKMKMPKSEVEVVATEDNNIQNRQPSSIDTIPEQIISPYDTADLVHANEKSLAQVFGSTIQTPLITAADINRMNRERGLEIVAMAGRYEALVDSASRSPAANMERNKIWRKITEEINKKYSHLNILTFEQCKKLCKYYKRKDPTNYGIAFHSLHSDLIPSTYKEQQQQQAAIAIAAVGNATAYVTTNGQIDEPIDVDELLEANDVVDGICCDTNTLKMKQDEIASLPIDDIVREDDKPSKDLLQFLAQCSASSSSNSTDGLVLPGQQAVAAVAAAAVIANQQKKERGQYVCKLAETFNGVFDSHSRLYHINAERNQVWKQITDSTNEKYGSELGDLTIEQTKKLYANYRRKSQLLSSNNSGGGTSRSEAGSISGAASADLDSDASSSNSDLLTRLVTPVSNGTNGNSQIRTSSPTLLPRLTPRDRKSNIDMKNGFVNHAGNVSQRISANPGLSSVELLAIIADRDAEIKQLKNELLQKSVEHQLQISRVLEKVSDLVKAAVNTNVQREIMSAMTGIAGFSSYHDNGFCDKSCAIIWFINMVR
ncbi:putative pectinesterase/pectinesterase inhibitor [Dirofilaria immitis]